MSGLALIPICMAEYSHDIPITIATVVIRAKLVLTVAYWADNWVRMVMTFLFP